MRTLPSATRRIPGACVDVLDADAAFPTLQPFLYVLSIGSMIKSDKLHIFLTLSHDFITLPLLTHVIRRLLE